VIRKQIFSVTERIPKKIKIVRKYSDKSTIFYRLCALGY